MKYKLLITLCQCYDICSDMSLKEIFVFSALEESWKEFFFVLRKKDEKDESINEERTEVLSFNIYTLDMILENFVDGVL